VTFVAMLVAVCLAPEVRAQSTTSGELTSVVADQSNGVVPNAEVEIKDDSKGTIESTKTIVAIPALLSIFCSLYVDRFARWLSPCAMILSLTIVSATRAARGADAAHGKAVSPLGVNLIR
jgi:hypothetical protein